MAECCVWNARKMGRACNGHQRTLGYKPTSPASHTHAGHGKTHAHATDEEPLHLFVFKRALQSWCVGPLRVSCVHVEVERASGRSVQRLLSSE